MFYYQHHTVVNVFLVGILSGYSSSYVEQSIFGNVQGRWLSVDEMKSSAALLRKKRWYGVLYDGVFAVTDGSRMPCVSFTNNYMQNAYFQEYLQEVEITNLLVWDVHEDIVHAAVDYPGSWHYNHLAAQSGLEWPLLSNENTTPGFAVLCHSAFVNNITATNGKIVRALKWNELSQLLFLSDGQPVNFLLQRLYPRERQSGEWEVLEACARFPKLMGTPLQISTSDTDC